jgi:23S rRNA pseudouridine955/2504/2580 synthase
MSQYTRNREHTYTGKGGGVPAAAMSEERCFVAGSDDEGRRLDRLIRIMFPETDLGSIYRSIRRGDIRLNQKRAAAHSRVRPGDRITIRGGSHFSASPPGLRQAGLRQAGEKLSPALIVFENRHILALNKPRGMLTHGPASLEELVAASSPSPRRDSLAFRPGPLQRLDRNTSGLILFSRSLYGARRVSALLRERKISKIYLALLDGVLASPQVWTDRLVRDTATGISRAAAGPGARQRREGARSSGQTARTVVTPLACSAAATLAACRLVTGRTHQIRVQAARHGHPLAGDRKYGGSQRMRGYILHSFLLRLDQEDSELGFRSLCAPLPETSRRRIESLFGRADVEVALLRVTGTEKV